MIQELDIQETIKESRELQIIRIGTRLNEIIETVNRIYKKIETPSERQERIATKSFELNGEIRLENYISKEELKDFMNNDKIFFDNIYGMDIYKLITRKFNIN